MNVSSHSPHHHVVGVLDQIDCSRFGSGIDEMDRDPRDQVILLIYSKPSRWQYQ